jgi:hypothetical protein
MKSVSVRKLSILGIVLMAASALTAAVIPSNKKDSANRVDREGNMIDSTNEVGGGAQGKTCGPKLGGSVVTDCISTEGSDTTTGFGSSNPNDGQTTNERIA